MNTVSELKPLAPSATVLRFADSDTVSFAPTSDGMEVTIQVVPLPHFDRTLFAPAFRDYLLQFALDDPLTMHLLHDVVRGTLHQSMAMHALLDTLKPTKGGAHTPA